MSQKNYEAYAKSLQTPEQRARVTASRESSKTRYLVSKQRGPTKTTYTPSDDSYIKYYHDGVPVTRTGIVDLRGGTQEQIMSDVEGKQSGIYSYRTVSGEDLIVGRIPVIGGASTGPKLVTTTDTKVLSNFQKTIIVQELKDKPSGVYAYKTPFGEMTFAKEPVSKDKTVTRQIPSVESYTPSPYYQEQLIQQQLSTQPVGLYEIEGTTYARIPVVGQKGPQLVTTSDPKVIENFKKNLTTTQILADLETKPAGLYVFDTPFGEFTYGRMETEKGLVTVKDPKLPEPTEYQDFMAKLTPEEARLQNRFVTSGLPTVGYFEYQQPKPIKTQTMTIDALEPKVEMPKTGFGQLYSPTFINQARFVQQTNINKSIEQKNTLINELVSNKVITRTDNRITLIKPITELTATEFKSLETVGFNIPKPTTQFSVSEIKQQNKVFYEALRSGQIGLGEFKTVSTQQDLNLYVRTEQDINYLISQDIVEKVPMVGPLSKGQERPTSYTVTRLGLANASDKEFGMLQDLGFNVTSKMRTQAQAIQRLEAADVVSVEGNEVVFKASVTSLPDNLYKDAQTLGFKVDTVFGEQTDIGKAPSFIVLDWLKENAPSGIIPAIIDAVTGQKKGTTTFSKQTAILNTISGKPPAAEAFATGIGGIETAVLDVLNFPQLFTGKPTIVLRTVSPDTISYTRNVSSAELTNLRFQSVAGYGVGSFIVSAGVGTATDLAFAGVRGIIARVGVQTPKYLGKAATAIATRPNLAKGLVYGTAGVFAAPSYIQSYKQLEAGKIDSGQFVFDVTKKTVGMAAGFAGAQVGLEAGKSIRRWYAKRELEMIPTDVLVSERNQQSKLYTYPDDVPQSKWGEWFKKDAQRNIGEEYFGGLDEGKYRIYRGAENVLQGEEHIVQEYYSITEKYALSHKKYRGAYFASEPSALRLGRTQTLSAPDVPSRVGLAGGSVTRYLMVTDSGLASMPTGLTHPQSMRWLDSQVGKGTAFIPSDFISSEAEAIMPMGTRMVKVGSGWGMQFGENVAVVDKWTPISTQEYNVLISGKLPTGMEVSTFGEVVSRTSFNPPTETLSIGSIPQTVPMSDYKLPSLAQVSVTSKRSNLSDRSYEISNLETTKTIISNIEKSVSKVVEPSVVKSVKSTTLPTSKIVFREYSPTGFKPSSFKGSLFEATTSKISISKPVEYKGSLYEPTNVKTQTYAPTSVKFPNYKPTGFTSSLPDLKGYKTPDYTPTKYTSPSYKPQTVTPLPPTDFELPETKKKPRKRFDPFDSKLFKQKLKYPIKPPEALLEKKTDNPIFKNSLRKIKNPFTVQKRRKRK